ncbi:MAG: hypothetical protein ACTHOE_04000 [Conexibacter sp.]
MSAFGVLALIVLVAIAAWLMGSAVLRAVGLFFFFGGLLTIVIAGRIGLLPAVILGAVLWLAGHWLYAYRHHAFVSPLARRIFLQALPRRFDPTRGWGVPVIDVSNHDR